MSRNIAELVRAARRVSTPLLAISTADQPALIALLVEAINGSTPMIKWDCNRGLRHLNETGQRALGRLSAEARESALAPNAMLDSIGAVRGGLPEETVVFMHNAGLFLREPTVIQGVANLRDTFKQDRRTLVMLSPSFDLPPALTSDVVLLEEDLPEDAQLSGVATQLYGDAGLGEVPAEMLPRVVSAVRGLSRFAAEQVIAMSLRESGVDIQDAWDRKKAAIDQTKGLTFTMGGPSFGQIGGNAQVCAFGRRLFESADGARRESAPQVVLFVDEIEKMLAGAGGGDLSGISQDQMGAFLRNMEDNGWKGMLAIGPGGGGKTQFGTSLAATFGVPRIGMDFGAMKGSLVGESEQSVRAAMRTVLGIGGSRVFVVATCNKLDVLPPELRRRFRSGIWFFDIPSAEERAAIWQIHLRNYGLDAAQPKPDDADWTGAEIRNCCEGARDLGCSLQEASAYVVPIMQSAPESVLKLREMAAGRFLSAAYPGAYRMPSAGGDNAPHTGGRRLTAGVRKAS